MLRSRILGTGKSLPERVMTNADIAKLVDTSDEWVVARSGIRERRILEPGRTTSDLAAEAGARALQAADVPASALDAIVVCTFTPDSPLPACAVTVQKKLGASCAAFDVVAACAGFIYGLSVGDAYIRSGMMKRVLVIGAEVLSHVTDWSDRNTCVLFGDGAGAVELGASEESAPARGDPRGILSTHIFADGSQAELLNIPAGGVSRPTSPATLEAHEQYIKMQGKSVFVHAVRNISRAALLALSANGKTAADVDLVVAHQANLRILEAVAEKTQLPLSKFFLNIAKYGNTSSASIPIALDEAVREGRVKDGDLLLFGALGGGFAWGSALVRW